MATFDIVIFYDCRIFKYCDCHVNILLMFGLTSVSWRRLIVLRSSAPPVQSMSCNDDKSCKGVSAATHPVGLCKTGAC